MIRVDSSARYDLSPVLDALANYTRRHQCPSASVSGWEVEDAAIRPPTSLLHGLQRIPARPVGYACPRDFTTAKARAVTLLGEHVRLGGAPLRPTQVTFTANSTQALLLVFAALAERGITRIAVAAPCYYAAVESARRLGMATDVVPASDYLTGALDLGRLAAVADGHTAILVTNPAYSVGVAHATSALQTLIGVIGERTPLVLDEARLGLPWADEPPWYAARYPDSVTIIRSPSKMFFADGAKLGIVLGAAPIVGAVERIGEALVGSLPGNGEAVALAYLDALAAWDDECASGQLGPYRAWRADVVTRLRANLAQIASILDAAGYMHSFVDSGPYALAARPQGAGPVIESVAVAREHGVLVMDARYFLHESAGYHGFRVNLTTDGESLPRALVRVLGSPADGA